MPTPVPTLGALLRGLRDRERLTLKQMSEKCGIPVSTLSKVEHDRLTLSYDKLYQLSQRLGIRMSDLFAEPTTPRRRSPRAAASATLPRRCESKRPITNIIICAPNLRRKRMIPVITRIRAKTSEEFGELVHHPGEEFIYVLRGSVVVNTEFYDPVVLGPGQSIYLDSNMGHAYLAADGCDEAEVLGVMSSGGDDLQQSLMSIHDAHGGQSDEPAVAALGSAQR